MGTVSVKYDKGSWDMRWHWHSNVSVWNKCHRTELKLAEITQLATLGLCYQKIKSISATEGNRWSMIFKWQALTSLS